MLAFLAARGLADPMPAADAVRLQGQYVLGQARSFEAERVRATVERAASTTALHREHLAGSLTDRDWLLESLPTLQKHDLRRHFPRGLLTDETNVAELLERGDLVLASTSGSTGERLQVYSDTRILRLPTDVLELWALPGLHLNRPIRAAVYTSPLCSGTTCTRGRSTYGERIAFENTLFLESPDNPFDLTQQGVDRTLEEMRRFEADLWFVNPVYLAALLKRATEWGFELPRPRAVLVSFQFFSHCQKRALARYLGVPVFQLYTATELGGCSIGVSCAHGNLHVRLDQVFLELLTRGTPVADGDVGRVTVTTHHPVMPLVRYSLGDLARFTLAPCPCGVGSAWPSIVVMGRVDDAFQWDGRRITTRDVDESLQDTALEHYQLVELSPGNFRFDAKPESDGDGWKGSAESALQLLLNPESLAMRRVDSFELDRSQKHRFTVPHLGDRGRQEL